MWADLPQEGAGATALGRGFCRVASPTRLPRQRLAARAGTHRDSSRAPLLRAFSSATRLAVLSGALPGAPALGAALRRLFALLESHAPALCTRMQRDGGRRPCAMPCAYALNPDASLVLPVF